MAPKRRNVFDPELAKAKAKKAKDNSTIYRQFEELGNEFLTLLEKNKSALSTYIPSSVALTELLLVGTLGLKGVQWVQSACSRVPQKFPQRMHEIKDIVNFCLPEVSMAACKALLGGLLCFLIESCLNLSNWLQASQLFF